MTKKAITLTLVALSLNLAPATGQDFASVRRSTTVDAGSFPSASVLLGGIMVSNEDWTATDVAAGVYTLEAKPNGKMTCVKRVEGMANTAAALYRDNILYAVEGSITDGFHYLSYSTNTWNAGTREEIDVVNVPSDLTYDPVTAKTYGGFWDENYGGYSRFASFNVVSAEAKDIPNATRDERDIFAIAADGKGTIYGLFGAFDYLATFDPKTGAATRIGTTGLSPVASVALGRASSMCYDAVNERLLAAVYQEDGYGASKTRWSGLYEINVTTGKATELYRFDGNASIAGLYIADDRPSVTAPTAARNLTVDFSGATTGTVEFDAPTLSCGGAPLSDGLMAKVSVGDNSVVVGDIKAGEHVSVPGLAFANGNNTVKVIMANATERGESTELTLWAGEDLPTAVEGLTLSVADGVAHLEWTAPTVGVNGGNLIAENLRYTVTRYPDGQVVAADLAATSYDDASLNPSWKALYYTVTCSNSVGTSAAATSNKTPAAGAMPIPFSETFDSADDFGCWTVIDLNGGTSWGYDTSGRSARYEYHREKLSGDDWLVSPPLAVKAGQLYKLSYGYRAYNARYPESFEVAVGNAATVEALDKILATHTGINNTTEQVGTVSFMADADGEYFVGFHCVSAPNMWYLYIDNVTVEAVDSRVPAAAEAVSVVPGADGALNATIKFTTPTKDAEGGALSGLTTVKVMRDGKTEPVAVLSEGLEPGKEYSVEDTDVAQSGKYIYSVICINEIGESLPATVEKFVGTDAPGAVGSLTISERDRHPVLTWEAPTAGANGGWFDASAVTYRIVRSDGEAVAENVTECTFTDLSYTSSNTAQEVLWYLVTPYTGSVKGSYAQTFDLYLAGKPYATPATETFANADMVYYPWMTQSSNAVNQAWTLDPAGYQPTAADQSGDRGLATFHSVGEPAGTVSYFYSPKFDLSGLANPTLGFMMYHTPTIAGEGSLDVLVSTGGDFEPLTESIARTDADADGWVRHSVSLADFKDAAYVRFAFRGTGDAAADIYLDNVTVGDAVTKDAAVTTFAGPGRVAAGVACDFDVKVYNNGVEALRDLTVTVSAGTQILATQTVGELASGKEETLAMAVALPSTGAQTLTARVSVAGDSDADNDTATLTVTGVDAVVPAPTGLTVEATDGGASLSWTVPNERGAVTDDVESYSPWAIAGVGEWTMYDGDYDVTYYISNGVEYANASSRKAFQVLDVAKLGIDIWEEGKAHSGKRLFAALASVNYVNDDWLISPRLNGAEQWVSFYARSFTTQNTPMERMRVHYSTTDTDAANFTALTENYIELDGVWREFRYFLPEGTRYFAVNCVSDGAFAMFVDDLTFNDVTVPAWELTGYEVLRDGEPVGTTAEPSYVDAEAVNGAVYTVRAIYGEHGAGPECEGVKYEGAGLDGVAAGDVVPVAVYTVDGVEVSLAPSPGVYVVRYSDGSVRKVCVK